MLDRFLDVLVQASDSTGGLFRTEHDGPDRKPIEGSPRRRRLVVHRGVEAIEEVQALVETLVTSTTRFVLEEDVPWILDRVTEAASSREQLRWLKLVEPFLPDRASHESRQEFLNLAWTADLKGQFGRVIGPIDLSSVDADRMRSAYEFSQPSTIPPDERERERLANKLEEERIGKLLDLSEKGQERAWLHVGLDTFISNGRLGTRGSLEHDVRKFRAWQLGDKVLRARIVSSAEVFLRGERSLQEEWFGQGNFHSHLRAGYQALRLLLHEAPDRLMTLPTRSWQEWAPVILSYPLDGVEQLSPEHQQLVQAAFENAWKRVVQCVSAIIDQQAEAEVEGGRLFILRQIESRWDERVETLLCQELAKERLNPASFGDLLSTLLQHDSEKAYRFAESLLDALPSADEVNRKRSLHAAAAMLSVSPDRSWNVIFPLIDEHPSVGRDIVTTLVRYHEQQTDANLKSGLPEGRAAALYVWMMRAFPPEEYPWPWEGFQDLKGMVADFREGLFRDLKGRGTSKAAAALRKISEEFPDRGDLKWTLVEARRLEHRRNWVPPDPRQLLEVFRRSGSQIVESEEQLVEAIIGSLEKLQSKLQGETPTAQFLWNEAARGTWQPKEEKALSDFVAAHLRESLPSIVVGREVEIRPGGGGRDGQVTDLRVTAIASDSRSGRINQLGVLVETKGCWNTELRTAMEMQLKGRYLAESDCRAGLYLVGWFRSSLWDSDDQRNGKTPGWTRDEAQNFFAKQALEHSDDVFLRAYVLDVGLRAKP